MTIGRRVYGLAAIVLGVPALVFGSFGALGLAVPPELPAHRVLAEAGGAWLVLAGLAANLPRLAAIGSLALAAFFALCLLALHLPHAAGDPLTWVSWEAVAETTVMMLGGVLAWTWASPAGETRAAAVMRIARPLFGLCLMIFGTSEFVYVQFTAAFVPAWLPPSGLFWAYLTGACQIAAGLAVASGIKARLAAILLTIMYLIFGLIVHLPRAIADPSALGAWAENGVNLVLAGAALLLVDSLGRANTSVALAMPTNPGDRTAV